MIRALVPFPDCQGP